MQRGKEPPLSLCERKFILEAIREGKRLDGREIYDYRNLQISLREEHVEVQLGGTRVLACASCEVVRPQPNRPSEGQLFFNVGLSPMASPAFEVGRHSGQGTEMERILERCFKESRAVDTESLCIISGAKVWMIRIDLHVLDHCGNIIDCAAVAAITALKHFRRPDVTVIGEEATIHPVTERDPVPLSVHHMPLCITFAFFWEGEYLLVDPTHHEESVMDGRLVVGMNIHREICALQMVGGVAILPDQVLRCSQIAAVKCTELTEIIKSTLSGTKVDTRDFDSILSTKKPWEELSVPEVVMEEAHSETEEAHSETEAKEEEKPQVTQLGEGTAELGMGGVNTWEVEEGECSNGEEEDRQEKTVEVKESVGNGSSSEEERTMVVTEREIGGFEKPDVPAGVTKNSSPDLTIALKNRKKRTKKSQQKQQTSQQQSRGRKKK